MTSIVNKNLKLNVKAPAVVTDNSSKDNSSKDKAQVRTKGSILRDRDQAHVAANTKALETKASETESVQAVSEGVVLSLDKPVQEVVNEKRTSKASTVLTDKAGVKAPVVLTDKAGVKDK